MQINIRPIQEERIKNSVKAPQREPPSTCVSSENDTENVTTTPLYIPIKKWKYYLKENFKTTKLKKWTRQWKELKKTTRKSELLSEEGTTKNK